MVWGKSEGRTSHPQREVSVTTHRRKDTRPVVWLSEHLWAPVERPSCPHPGQRHKPPRLPSSVTIPAGTGVSRAMKGSEVKLSPTSWTSSYTAHFPPRSLKMLASEVSLGSHRSGL